MAETSKSNQYIIAGAIIIAGLLIAGGIFLSKNEASQGPRDTVTDENSGVEVAEVTADDHIVGSLDADLIVIEFSDIECPFCQTFHDTMKEVVAGDDRIAWVFRHFPIDSLHRNARAAAHSTECAAELGGNEGFWNYTNALFSAAQANGTRVDLSALGDIAVGAGLDRAAFEECQDSNRHAAAVRADETDARNSGGRGTPHNILLTQRGDAFALPGGLPKDMMLSVIDTIIAGVERDASYETIIADLSALF